MRNDILSNLQKEIYDRCQREQINLGWDVTIILLQW